MTVFGTVVRLVAVGSLLLGTAVPASARPQIELTCSAIGTDNAAQTYFLAGDLDCSGMGSFVQLTSSDRLELRGYTLTGMHVTASGNTKILGPGTIAGAPNDCIRHSAGQLRVEDVTITGCTRYGIVSLAGKMKVTDSTITGNGIDGLAAYRAILLDGVTVTGNGRYGVSTRPDGVVPGGAPCTETAKATIKGRSATLTGNGTGGDCGVTETCADVATCGRLPKLKGSTCEHSYQLESGVPGTPLGICTLD